MTRERAIEYFKFHRKIFCEDHLKICPKDSIAYQATLKEKEFYDMAIKALEQKPCEDCVSRQAVLEKINDWWGITSTSGEPALCDCIRELPPVTPTQRWIPVSERLPEEMGTYMTTIDYGEHGLVTGPRYYYGRGLKWNDECVIAWQPLPEPYKKEVEE